MRYLDSATIGNVLFIERSFLLDDRQRRIYDHVLVMTELAQHRPPSAGSFSPGPVTKLRVICFAMILVVMLVMLAAVKTFTPVPSIAEVHMLAGSENQPFFDDQRVKQAFARHGLRLVVEYQGSREMAGRPDLCSHDLALPSSSPAGDKIKQVCHAKAAYPVFFSPMMIGTFGDLVPLLQQEGIVTGDAATGMWTFDVKRYLAVVDLRRRWDQIPGNTTYMSPNLVLATTTDPRASNSAAMYIAVTSSVLNGQLVTNEIEAHKWGPLINQKLFLAQGYKPSTSQQAFDDFISSLGHSLAPLLWAYEAQFVEVRLNNPGLVTSRNMVTMYPTPTVVADHTVVPLKPLGDQVVQLLSGRGDDPDLVRLEAEHGFRTHDVQDTFTKVMTENKITIPTPQVVKLPTFEILEALLDG